MKPGSKKIIIATGIFPPQVGGPAIYAKNISEELKKLGCEPVVLKYDLEYKMPIFIRHFFYFLKVVFNIAGARFILAFDTLSVGWPATLAGKLFGKKVLIRIGGDFLWESYIQRTGDKIPLSKFYEKELSFSKKEKIIKQITDWTLKNASALVFNTNWQKNIWKEAYELSEKRLFVVENFFKKRERSETPKEKVFLWSGREIKLKNIDALKDAFLYAQKETEGIKLEISENIPYEELLEKIKDSYAVILPSLTDIAPNFILDALSVGKPFLMTKESGLFESLKDVGVFFDPLNIEDIKEKMLFLADDKNYEDCLNKIKLFNKEHSWSQITEEFLNIANK